MAFRESRGRFPTGEEYQGIRKRLPRRARPPFTKAQSYVPLLKLMVQGLTQGQALDKLSSQDFDRRHAQRGVKRLRELMKPWETAPQDPP